MKEDMLFGKPLSYWAAMKNGLDKLDPDQYLDEIVRLRGEISYYEDKIRQLTKFMERDK